MGKRGGARPGAGRKKGINVTNTMKKILHDSLVELLKDEVFKRRALKDTEYFLFDDQDDEYLYIIKANGLCKIGYSTNLKKRITQYKLHNPDMQIVYIYKGVNAFKLESKLHFMYKSKHETGEWFNLEDNELIEAISYCSNFDLNH